MSLKSEKIRQRLRALIGPALIVLAASLVWIPFHLHGTSCGHDFDFHFESWVEIAQGWKNLSGHGGILYPHWAASPSWGAGEPRFVFYPPLTWILGATLGLLVGWDAAAPTLIWILLAATGLAVRALARQWFPDRTATHAGMIAIFCGYTLFTAFERSAFGELAGGIWIPLVLLFALRQKGVSLANNTKILLEEQEPKGAELKGADIADNTKALPEQQARKGTGFSPSINSPIYGRALAPEGISAKRHTLLAKAFDGSTLPLALVLAGAWLTNAPTGVMACYLLAFVALTAALAERTLWPVLRAVVAVPLGLGTAAFYLIPAAVEQRWIDIGQATSVGMRIQDSWLFARHSAPDLHLHDAVLHAASVLAAVMITLAIFGFLVALLRGKLNGFSRGALVSIAALAPLVLLLQFPFSGWLWDALPKLGFLQFPWRLLLLVEAPMALFLAAASAHRGRKIQGLIAFSWAVIFIATLSVSVHFFYQDCDEEDSVAGQLASLTSGVGVMGTDEYAPPGGDNSIVATGLPDACLVDDPNTQLVESAPDTTPTWDPEQNSCNDTFQADQWDSQHKRLTAVADKDGTLILRLRAYPAWRILLNGQRISALSHRDDGLIAVPVKAGTNQISIDWMTTPDVKLGGWISASSLLLLGMLGWIECKTRRSQAGTHARLHRSSARSMH